MTVGEKKQECIIIILTVIGNKTSGTLFFDWLKNTLVIFTLYNIVWCFMTKLFIHHLYNIHNFCYLFTDIIYMYIYVKKKKIDNKLMLNIIVACLSSAW